MTKNALAPTLDPIVEASIEKDDLTARLLASTRYGGGERRILVSGKFHLELTLSGRQVTSWANYPDHWKPTRWHPVGGMFLVPPGFEVHVRSKDGRMLRGLSFEFDQERIYRMMPGIPELMDWHLTEGLDLKLPALRTMMVRVAEEVRSPGFASGILLEALAALVAVELVRHGDRLENRQPRGGLAPWQLRAIDERLELAGRPPTLLELAVLCRLSVRQLCRAFSTSRGSTIGAYVAHHRLDLSRRLLAGDLDINAVAAELGFANASNFCVAFRRDTGMTPGQFRRSLLKRC